MSINTLNEDCILHIIKYLPYIEIFSFGATNARFKDLVSRYIQRIQNRNITIKQPTDDFIMINIIKLFGSNIHHMTIEVDKNMSNVKNNINIIGDEDQCFLNNIHTFRYTINLLDANNEYDGYFGPATNSREHMVTSLLCYKNIAFKFVEAISFYPMVNVTNLQLHLNICLDDVTFYEVVNDFDFLTERLHNENLHLFENLHRGNMEFDYEICHDIRVIVLKLEFKF